MSFGHPATSSSHWRMDASIITSFTGVDSIKSIIDGYDHHLQPNFTARDSKNVIRDKFISVPTKE